MRPTLAADALQRTLTQYLTIMFGLAERQVQDGLETFPTYPGQGIFRGPYQCRRQCREGDRGGWKALLYLMNALAADQTRRLDELLTDPELGQVAAASQKTRLTRLQPTRPGVAEVKRLFNLLAHTVRDLAYHLRWAWSRRRQQARARWFHYRARR